MTTVTRRQAEILRVVFAARRLHVRGIADKLGSPNRLRDDLGELVRKRCLHVERKGKEHQYAPTKTGLRCLGKYEVDSAGASIAILTQLEDANKNLKTELEGLQGRLDYIRYELEGGEDGERERRRPLGPVRTLQKDGSIV